MNGFDNFRNRQLWDPSVSSYIFHILLLLSFPSTGYKTRDDIPKLVTDYIQKKINIDALITHKLPFEKVNKAFKLLREENWSVFV